MERGYTLRKKNMVLYEWKINTMSKYLGTTVNNEDNYLLSSQFSTGAKVNDKWRLKLEFNNEPTSKAPNFLSIFLLSLVKHEVAAEFIFFILNIGKEQVFIRKLTKVFPPTSWGFSEFLEKERLINEKYELMPNDTLTVCVLVTAYEDDTTTSIKIPFKTIKSQMINDYKELYISKTGSDVMIHVQDKEFRAHKAILIARSPVLAAMFTHEMIEKKENKATIVDISPEIFEKVLEYIYTDEVNGLDNIADALLEAADKYQLETLKQMCQNSLSKTLTPVNAVYRMSLANRHNAHELLEYVTEFMVLNSEEVVNTKDFKEMEKLNSLDLMLFKKFSTLNMKVNENKITHSA